MRLVASALALQCTSANHKFFQGGLQIEVFLGVTVNVYGVRTTA